MPLISVIIPTYNRANLVGEAIESVLLQDFNDYEIIVVDDGSTDNTLEILNKFNNHLIVLHQPNQGVSAARNAGIATAGGRFIAFLDSDDLWLKQKLTAQIDFFQSHRDALICQTEEIWIRNGVRVNPKKRHQKPSGMIFEPSLALCLVSPSAVMLNRKLFAAVGIFDPSLPACEDYDLWLRISCRYPVYLINTPLIIKKGGHADQLSRRPGLDKYRIMALRKLIESGRLTPVQQQAAIVAAKKKCAVYIHGCLKRDRSKEALYYKRICDDLLVSARSS
jgi:glycosyltransferase involved in cell wall biosynthesis